MFSYVFLDPAIIEEATAAGEMGLGRLVDLLVSFQKDVILVETDSWRLHGEIGESVKAIPDDFQIERKKIGDLLIWLGRNSPSVLVSGDDGELSWPEFATENASEASIDLILSPGPLLESPDQSWVKVSLASNHQTEWSKIRARLQRDGLQFTKGCKSFAEVADDCFAKLVRHAEYIQIYDYAFGKYYNNDQPVNFKKLVRYLESHAAELKELRIHTLSDAKVSIARDVVDLQNEVDFEIIIDYKENGDEMPHNRYFGADHRFLDIDRGIDLCDRDDRCRFTQIKYAARP